jgi:DNA-binding CsgD family transcriptional regulator
MTRYELEIINPYSQGPEKITVETINGGAHIYGATFHATLAELRMLEIFANRKLSYKEIAKYLGLSVQTVNNTMYNVRQRNSDQQFISRVTHAVALAEINGLLDPALITRVETLLKANSHPLGTSLARSA